MRIAAAQVNLTVGDFKGNGQKMASWIERAKQAGASVVVFPELAVCGYPPRDLLDDESFVEGNLEALRDLAAATKGITALVGFVERNPSASGKRYHNAAAVLTDGRVETTYRKQLLPVYDVFDEERYFEPGTEPCVITVKGRKFGVTICEDAWNVPGYLSRAYPTQPLEALKGRGLSAVLNLSASPFSLGKSLKRAKLLAAGARQVGAPLFLCNQVGGNDELLFDGASLGISTTGQLVAVGKAFEEDLVVVDLDALESGDPVEPPWPATEPEWLHRALSTGLSDYLAKTGARSVLLGLSGGIDSSVLAALAVDALGRDAVAGFSLPARFTAGASVEDAERLAEALGIEFRVLPIEPILELYEALWQQWFRYGVTGVTRENLQPRIRMTVLMALANERNAYLLCTSNKSEIATGYSTLYGDTAGALAPLGDLTKGQVYALARYLNSRRPVIPERVLERPPTAELRENQTDQDTLPPYDVLDPIVRAVVEQGVSASGLREKGFPAQAMETFARLYRSSEFKRNQMPPVLRVSERAFGIGRRIPLAVVR